MLRVFTESYFRKDYNSTLLLQNLLVFNIKGIFQKQGKKTKDVVSACPAAGSDKPKTSMPGSCNGHAQNFSTAK